MTREAILPLRATWNRWAHSLESDFDYFRHKLLRESGTIRPYVILVFCEQTVVAMLVGAVRKSKAYSVVSGINIPGPPANVLEIKRGARMGPPSQAVDRILALELLRAAKTGDVDFICLERLPLDSELYLQIQSLSSFLISEQVPHTFYYSMLDFAGTGRAGPNVFSGKARREFRRKTRILERAFADQMQLKCFEKPDEADEGIRDVLRVSVTTWQHSLGLGIADTPVTREMLGFFARRGWLRINLLYLKDTPCAFLVGEIYHNTFYCQYAGYDPSFAQFSVGSVLTTMVFQDLAAAGVQRVDLGEGGQEHNRRLGCELSEEGTVHVYSPTLRGLWLNVFFGTTGVIRRGGRRTRCVFRLGRVGKIWRAYRNLNIASGKWRKTGLRRLL